MVSVIIPTYNRAKTLSRAILSAIHQTYRDIEIIVVDDGSTDNTKEIVNQYDDPRIKYIYQEHANGNVARNRGILASNGEYLAFLDSDDALKADKIKTQLAVMQAQKCQISFHDLTKTSGEKSSTVNKSFREGFISSAAAALEAIFPGTLMVKREVFNSVLFDPNVTRMQGYDWQVRAVDAGCSIYYINQALIDYYIQDDSISMSGSKRLADTAAFLLSKYQNNICKKNPNVAIYLLKIIIMQKSLCGEHPISACSQLYEIQKTNTNLIRFWLSKLHLLPLVSKLTVKI